MKKIYVFLTILTLVCIDLQAQVPQAFNYQAIARDKNGVPVINKDLIIEVTIRAASPIGSIVWQEGHVTRTNEYGLFSLRVGEGASTNVGSASSFDQINWGVASHYIGIRIDFGNGLESMGVTELLSVPYAIFAQDAGNSNAQTLSLTGNQLTISGGNTITLTDKVNDADADPNNEIQQLVLNGNQLSLTNGNTITFPGDNDADSTNEIQTLRVIGDSLELSDANRIAFPQSTWQKKNKNIYFYTGKVTIGDDKPISDSTSLTIIDTNIKNNPSVIYAYSKGSDNFFETSNVLVSHIEGYNGNNRAIYALSDGKHFGTNVGIFAKARNAAENYGIQSYVYGNGDADSTFGLYGISAGPAGVGGVNAGVVGKAQGSTFLNVGVNGITKGVANGNYGVFGSSEGAGSGVNIGVDGYAQKSGLANYGLYGDVDGAGSAPWNIGVFSDMQQSTATNTYGLYSMVPSGKYAGFFSGDLGYTGSLVNASDRMLKKEIKPIANSLDLVKKLHPVNYYYDNDYSQKGISLAQGLQYGFIANDLEKVLPGLVKDMAMPLFSNPDDPKSSTSIEKLEFKGINYIGLIPVLTGAIQQQQKIIDQQQEEMDALKAQFILLQKQLEQIQQKLDAIENH